MQLTQGPIFPADVFHLIASELCDRKDFATLYNCVVSSRFLGSCGAVAALYRISAWSPVKDGGDESSIIDKEISVQRCSILWRSVCLSTFGKTLHPYCRHLRVLELENLKNLLSDDKFSGKVATKFFSQDLAKFHYVGSVTTRRRQALDIKRIVTAMGDEITRHAPLLEELMDSTYESVISDSGILREWLPRLAHLRSIRFWDGKVLADQSIRDTLQTQCRELRALGMYHCSSEEGDAILANFINGTAAGSLESFDNYRNSHIGVETCIALNTQGASLTTLELSLSREGILALAYLKECTALQRLKVEAFDIMVDLKATENDVYLEILAWLQKCDALRSVHFVNLRSAPDLLLPILLNPQVCLENLEIAANEQTLYVVKDHHDFHQALTQQRSLRHLVLTADPEPAERDDLETLVDCLCSLSELRELTLKQRISEYLSNEHICLFATHLPYLKELEVGGLGLSDQVWPSLARLRSLESLTITVLTQFTAKGILGFINELGAGNANLMLSTQYQDSDHPILPEEQELIRKTIVQKVDGRFEYQLLRDPNAFSDDSGSDSD